MRRQSAKTRVAANRSRGTKQVRQGNRARRSASQFKRDNRSASPMVFIVDDDPSALGALGRLITSGGLRVKMFDRPSALLHEKLPSDRACLILDVNLPEMDGIKLHERLKKSGTLLPTIFITGQTDPETQLHLEKTSAVAILFKPVHERVLFEAIRLALNAK